MEAAAAAVSAPVEVGEEEEPEGVMGVETVGAVAVEMLGEMVAVSDFDVYSMGKNRDTVAPLNPPKSQDDIIRASDGGYYGLARNF
ncbi:MAG TPA: hypothetical protein PKW35_11955 [Nannocystaceae bacterium]|nr:hypothetical protein [Nannocystaceae bacterium]